MKINSILKSGAIRHPNKDALVTPQRTWTYRQLQEDAAKTATLFTDRGAGEGSTIAAMTYNEAEFVITAFATWMLGATFGPVNHKFATPRPNTSWNTVKPPSVSSHPNSWKRPPRRHRVCSGFKPATMTVSCRTLPT